jgi:hypothetical protein
MFSGPSRDRLYRGQGQGEFLKIAEGDLVTDTTSSGGIIWTDYDADNDLDLMISKPGADNVIYRNDGGAFAKVTGIDFLLESGTDQNWADYDNDGDLDLYIAKWNGDNNSLYENLGGGNYSKVSGQSIVEDGEWATGSCWGDFDNDGDLDMLVINDNSGEDRPDYFYINDGSGNFTSLVDSEYVDLPGSFSCKVSAADYDRNGALDIYLVNWYEGEPNCLYKNNGNENSWILIKPVGTNSNRSAIGTKIRILATIDGSPVWQLREFTGRTGSRTENSCEVHFGLGDAAVIDSIRIEWPSGMVDVYTDVAVNHSITYLESLCGDADGSEAINLLDVSFIISYLYKNGPAPEPEAAADADGSGVINLLDVTYLINYLYKNGPEPVC